MKNKYKISEKRILEITDNVFDDGVLNNKRIDNEIEMSEVVKYWKNQRDDLVIYLNKELKPKADKLVKRIYKIIDDNTKN